MKQICYPSGLGTQTHVRHAGPDGVFTCSATLAADSRLRYFRVDRLTEDGTRKTLRRQPSDDTVGYRSVFRAYRETYLFEEPLDHPCGLYGLVVPTRRCRVYMAYKIVRVAVDRDDPGTADPRRHGPLAAVVYAFNAPCPTEVVCGPKGGWFVRVSGEARNATVGESVCEFTANRVVAGDGEGGLWTCGLRKTYTHSSEYGPAIQLCRYDPTRPLDGRLHLLATPATLVQTNVTDFEFSPCGSVLAVALNYFHNAAGPHSSGLQLYDARAGFAPLSFFDVPASTVSFAPDGMTLAVLGRSRESWLRTVLSVIDME